MFNVSKKKNRLETFWDSVKFTWDSTFVNALGPRDPIEIKPNSNTVVAVYSKYPKVRLSLNTGWSSSQNAGGHRILALQAQLVTAHGKTFRIFLAGFPQALEIMENLEITKKSSMHGKIMEFEKT